MLRLLCIVSVLVLTGAFVWFPRGADDSLVCVLNCGNDAEDSFYSSLEQTLWREQSSYYQESREAGFSPGVPWEHPMLIAKGSVSRVKAGIVKLSDDAALWSDEPTYTYDVQEVGRKEIQEFMANLRERLAGLEPFDNGDYEFENQPLLAREVQLEDEFSTFEYRWTWWPSPYGQVSLGVLESRNVMAPAPPAGDIFYLISQPLTVRITGIKDDNQTLVELGHLQWWCIGEWVGISKSETRAPALLLTPGLKILYANMRITVSKVSKKTIELSVERMMPHTKIFD